MSPTKPTTKPTTEPTTEPIAIIGIGCRFPGADSPADFWQLLKRGKQAITPVPPERWPVETYYDPNPDAAGKMSSAQGGFLSGVDQFDAAFFGICDEEAQHIDPQQRLFLEVAWEALEHASIAPLNLGGSATGVFTGLCTIDYHRLLYRNADCIGPHSGTGTTMSITANRLSYLLDLRGPSMAVDAACSSSLVAVHLACQSLRSQESNLCIAGGVNLILSPDSMISSSQTGLLSAKGACRPFDAKADGYVRGEGCGVVVLKRLADAQADGDPVLAIIRGSAINQDGLSNSLTAPNGLAQQALIQRALEIGNVSAKDIDYVEAHAVGTPLGDAIEFKALKQVLMDSERSRPCRIGSLKPNIGHLEAASGIAALIKVVLSLHHESIPPQLNFEQANPYVNFDNTLFEIAKAEQPWPRSSRPRIAGVSTFGFGGTNAHLVVAEAPVNKTIARSPSRLNSLESVEVNNSPIEQSFQRSHHLLTITAKSESALRHLAERYSHFLDSYLSASHAQSSQRSAPQISDVCFTANTGRSHFAHRLCLVSDSSMRLRQQLTQFCKGESAAEWITGRVKGRKRPRTVFHFPEATVGTLRMGKVLYRTQPTFRQIFDRCAQRSPIPISLESTLPKSVKASGFVVAYAIATLWKQWGVKPAALTGEGTGELTAACVAGLLDIEQAIATLGDSTKSLQAQASLLTSLPKRFLPLEPEAFELAGYDRVLIVGADRNLRHAMPNYAGQIAEMSLQSELEIWPQLLTQLGQLFVAGIEIDWAAFDKGYERSRLSLPTYPFERTSYWFSPPKPSQPVIASLNPPFSSKRSQVANNN